MTDNPEEFDFADDPLPAFFPDGRTMIIPIDHGTAIPVPGLENPEELISILNEFADGYVVNIGAIKAYGEVLGEKAICLRTDVYKPPHGTNPDSGSFQVYTINDALEVGADAVMNMCYPHHPNEVAMIRECAALISDGLALDIPVILETLPFGIGRSEDYTVENIGFAVRLAAELGADVVKTAFPTFGTVDDFRAIVESCPVPVVVLGGAAMGDDEALVRMVANAIAAGAAGIAVGRNVWQHPAPAKIARALHAVVHDDANAEAALKLI